MIWTIAGSDGMECLSDIALVAKVAVFGDNRAFGRLVSRYQSPVRRFFLNLTLGDTQLSDDLAQDTFVKAYTHIASFRGLSGFSTWLFRIAYNVFYDYTRSNRQTCGLDDIPACSCSSSGTDPVLQMDIYGALARLRPGERICVTLQLVDGMPVAKIAGITGMPEGTVKSHLSRGKEKLVIYLKKNGYDRR